VEADRTGCHLFESHLSDSHPPDTVITGV